MSFKDGVFTKGVVNFGSCKNGHVVNLRVFFNGAYKMGLYSKGVVGNLSAP